MDDLNMLPNPTSISNTLKTRSNTATSFYRQDEPITVQNLERFGMVYAQNNQQTESFPSASFTSLTNLHPTTYYQQPYNLNLQFPCMPLPEYQAPLAFPAASPFEDGGSGMGATGCLSLRGFLNEDSSKGQSGDTVQGACSLQPLGLSGLEEPRKLNASICKAARAKRMMARQMSARVHINSFRRCSSTGSPYSSTGVSRKAGKHCEKGSKDSQEDLYTFCTPNNIKLRVLLQKELTSCDVGTHRRIILPKRDAEKHLPYLLSKEGIIVVMRDVYSNHAWRMQYRFWANHKGRMYILDQFGDFVIKNGLKTGDLLNLYEDKSKNLYFSINKAQETTPMPSNTQDDANQTYNTTLLNKETTDEENSTLQILMEELKHTEYSEANSLMTL